MDMKYAVSHRQSLSYGMNGLQIMASSHPEGPPAPQSTFGPVKNVFPVDYHADQAFIIVYEAIHDELYAVIKAEFPGPDFSFSFTAFRLGFDKDQYKNPITIQVVISRVGRDWLSAMDNDDGKGWEDPDLSENEPDPNRSAAAGMGLRDTPLQEWNSLIKKASIIISKAVKLLTDRDFAEVVPIDICRALALADDLRVEANLLSGNPQVYNTTARRPGLSIGPAKTEKKHTVGTLTCFVKHTEKGKTEGFALTCRHVIDPDNTLSPKSRVSKNFNDLVSDGKQIMVDCPQHGDHSDTITTIERSIKRTAEDMKKFKKTLEGTNNLLGDQQLTLLNAQHYNIELGQVYATSGFDRVLPPLPVQFPFQGSSEGQPTGSADWILVKLTNHTIPLENKHISSTFLFDSFDHKTFDGVDDEFICAAKEALWTGPSFKPVRNDLVPGEVVFKPRSRTNTSWVGGTFNGIRSTESGGRKGTREICLIALSPKGCVSAPGDSGSIVVDKEFRPLGFLWGGHEHQFAAYRRDVTYVSMFCSVFRDIEICNGWEEGSVTMA